MKIREANINDIDNNLLNLYIEGFNMHYENRKDIFTKREYNELKNNLIDMLNNKDEIMFVIEDNEVIVGYVALQIKNKISKFIWIDEIVVGSNYRNTGYGKKLMDEIYKYAKENNCVRVELNCWNFNFDAHKFYDKLGFKQQRIIYEKEIQ